MGDYVVKYEYVAQAADELDLRIGDVVTNAVTKSEGWMEGKLGEKIGMFPDNFVTKVEKSSSSAAKAEATSAILKTTETATHNLSGRIFRVWYEYSPQVTDELKLEVGDEVEFIKQVEEGWWSGKLRDRVGLFPSNFVKEIQLNKKPKETLTEYVAKYDYISQEDEELNLKKGGIITNAVRKKDGWMEGTLQGKTGMFPGNFAKSIRTCEDPSRTNHDAHSSQTSKFSSETGPLEIHHHQVTSTRKLKACYSYSPEVKDELKLEVGDEIEFISEVEDGWWRGKLGNTVGVFPSNFVEELKEQKSTKDDSDSKKSTPGIDIQTPFEEVKPSAPNLCNAADSHDTPEITCSICWDEKIGLVFQCGHTIGSKCYAEMKQLAETTAQDNKMCCPQCRSPVTTVIKMYL